MLRQVPVLEKFGLMQLEPLQDVPQRTPREGAGYDAIENAYGNVVAAIRGMKVRRVVLPVKDADDDAKESAYFWHGSSLALRRAPA